MFHVIIHFQANSIERIHKMSKRPADSVNNEDSSTSTRQPGDSQLLFSVAINYLLVVVILVIEI